MIINLSVSWFYNVLPFTEIKKLEDLGEDDIEKSEYPSINVLPVMSALQLMPMRRPHSNIEKRFLCRESPGQPTLVGIMVLDLKVGVVGFPEVGGKAPQCPQCR